MRFSYMKIMTRILLGFSIIVILSVVFIGFFIYELNYTGNMLTELYNTFIVTNNSLATEIDIHALKSIIGDIESEVKLRNKSKIDMYIVQIDGLCNSVKRHLDIVKKSIKNENGKKTLADVAQLLKKWENRKAEFIGLVNNADYKTASEIIGDIKGHTDELIKKLSDLDFQTGREARKFHDETIDLIGKVIKFSIVIFIILLTVSFLVTLTLSKSIANSLSLFRQIFLKGSSGELEAKYPVLDKARDEMNELGKWFNKFIDEVRAVIKEVIDTSNDLGASSEELSVTTTSFASNAQNQAASTEEITAAMEEINAGIDNIFNTTQIQFDKLHALTVGMKEHSDIIDVMAGMTGDAQGLSKNISLLASSGSESLQSMNRIMTKISGSSQKVTDIIGIINDISDKINLLSLNAAIEAARAGDAGRGFAVVADEISKLADQTASSINDINSLIKENNDEISGGMGNVVNTIESLTRIIEGVEAINNMMIQIFSNMKRQQLTNDAVNKSADEIIILSEEAKNATEEQRLAVAEIMKSIATINQFTQSSAAASEEMTSNATKLASMAENLMSRINFFKV